MRYKNYFIFFFFIFFLVNCNSKTRFYENEIIQKEINEVLRTVIAEDSLLERFPDIKIMAYLPKYCPGNRDSSNSKNSLPCPWYVFPNMKYQLREFNITKEDLDYFNEQELNSKQIKISSFIFSNRMISKRDQMNIPFVDFSIPIFNNKRDLAVVIYNLNCGMSCGWGCTIVMIKKNGKWKKFSEYMNWIS